MKITCFATFLLLHGSQAFAPSSTTTSTGIRQTTSLSERHREEQSESIVDGWFGPAVAALASWTLAAQLAMAANPMVNPQIYDAPTQTVDAPSLVLSAAIETMDFSMPSYSKTLEGDTTGVKQAPGIPSFNPSFTFGIKEDKEETAAPAADTSAADEKVSKADERAAAEAKKAEEKAAAEAKKAEEKAAAEAKKAEKEARRLAEIEKQKEAVERAKQKDADKATAAPAKVDLQEMPDVSSFSVPKIEAPDVSIPKFEVPDVSIPKFEAPDIKIPDMPKFSMPKLDLPDKPDMPAFSAPSAPKFDAPSFSAPKFEAPKMPSVSMPSFDTPKSSGGYDFDAPAAASSGEDVEPQEVRDERARAAASEFRSADDEAKEAEKRARSLREIANAKKKTAKELKDDACKTRFGGKFICFRPLNSGY